MFKLGAIELEYMSHSYNCGTGKHRTERCVELPIADYWLSKVGNDVTEFGAVSPYYYPDRIKDVVDPVDKKATIKGSLFDTDFSGRDVLSISTIEHIGVGDYGYIEKDSRNDAILALGYIIAKANRWLVTWGYGYNPTLDAQILDNRLIGICNMYLLSRQIDDSWMQVAIEGLTQYGRNMANSVIILTNCNVFERK